MFPAPEGIPGPVPAAPETQELLDELEDLKVDLVGPAPEPEAPTVLHVAAAPEPPVAPEPQVMPGGDGGDGGKGGEPPEVVPVPPAPEPGPEPIKPPEAQKAEYEDRLLKGISGSRDTARQSIERFTSELQVTSLEPEESRLLETAVRAQGDLVNVDLGQLKTREGLRQAKLAEKEAQLTRIAGLEAKINALGLESTYQEAIKAAEHLAGLQTTGGFLQIELGEIETGIGELQADMAAATSERGKASLARDQADLEKKQLIIKSSLDQHQPQLTAAEKQAEEAQTRLVCIEKAVARFEADMTEPKALLATIEDELAKSGQVSAETQQKVENLRKQMGQKETDLRVDDALKDMEALEKALADLDPQFVHQGGLQIDAMRAMSAQFASPQLVDIHWVKKLASEHPETVNQIGLDGLLKQRADRMSWLYQLAQSGSAEEMIGRMIDSGRVDLPETFRAAAKSVLETGKMPEVAVEGLPRELAEALERRSELYLAVLNKFGVETAEQRTSREAREQYEAGKMQAAEGVAASIKAGEEAKQAAAKTEAEEAERQRLAQEAAERQRGEDQRRLQEEAKQVGEEAGRRTAAAEVAAAVLRAEFGAELPAGMEGPREGQSVDEWRNEVRGQMAEGLKAELNDAAGEFGVAKAGTDADVQRRAAEKLAAAMAKAGRIPDGREYAAGIFDKVLGIKPEGEDKKHDKGVADRMGEFADFLSGKLDVNKLVDRLVKGPLGRPKSPEALAAIRQEVIDAQAKQMANIRGGGLTAEGARQYAGKMKELNAALETAGFLGAGMGGLLDVGFQLAIQTMFGGK